LDIARRKDKKGDQASENQVEVNTCVNDFHHDMFVQNSAGLFPLRKQVCLISELYQKAWTQNYVDFFYMRSLLQFLLWFVVFC